MITFARMVVLVDDYDEASAFYVGKLGLTVAADIDAGERRYLHLTFPGQEPVGFGLMKAETEAEAASIGGQTGDQPCGVLYTEAVHAEHRRLAEAGVAFSGPPVEAEGSIHARFSDPFGNAFVLVQITAA
jgi:predicted enzyme related to lactoylglutathione lyase